LKKTLKELLSLLLPVLEKKDAPDTDARPGNSLKFDLGHNHHPEKTNEGGNNQCLTTICILLPIS